MNEPSLPIRRRKRTPEILVWVGIVLTLLLLTFSHWRVVMARRALISMNAREAQFHQVILAMSRMATDRGRLALDGLSQPEKAEIGRDSLRVQMHQALAVAESLGDQDGLAVVLTALRHADARLEGVETQALHLSRSGDCDSARSLLAGAEYIRLTSVFDEYLHRLSSELVAQEAVEATAFRQDLDRAGWTSGIVLVVLALAWLIILWRLTQHRAARSKAEDSLAQQGLIIDQIHDAVISTDLAGTIIGWNKGAERLYGYLTGEVIGQNLKLLCPDPGVLKHEVIEPVQARGTHDVELRLRRKSGREFWAHLSMTLLRDEHGVVYGMNGYSVDISERRQIEEALRTSEERYRTLFQTMAQGVVYQDGEGRIISANPAAARILGVNLEQMCGRTSMDPYWKAIREDGTPLPGDQHPPMIALATGVPAENVIAGVFNPEKDAYRWLLVSSMPQFRSGETRPYRVFTTFDDITDIRRVHEDLLRDRDRAQHYLDVTATIMVALNDRGEISLINRAGCELLGQTEKELLGSHWFERFVPGSSRHDVQHVFQRIMAGEIAPVEYYENPIITAAGEQRIIAWHNSLLRNAEGGITGTLSSGSDITERRRAEEELARHAGELERSNAELERFAHVTSHDLQEPLRMMASYSQLLEQRYRESLDQDAREFIGYIVNGAERMQRMIKDLLLLSQVDSRGKPFTRVDCQRVLREVLGNLAVAIKESGAQTSSDRLPVVAGDSIQLVELFQNLISNAIKFRGPETPRVHVSAEETATEWIFSVRDNGIGIAPRFHSRIFVVFQRLHGHTEHPGTGIGLAISKKIVERHGGRIWVESEPDRGSVFRFTIPKAAETRRRNGIPWKRT